MSTIQQQPADVREVQEYLRALSSLDHHYPHLAVDGFFGPDTAESVRVFQGFHDLPVTGKVDSETWNQLVFAYADALLLLTQAGEISPFPAPHFILLPGMQGSLVFILQAMIGDLQEILATDKLPVTGQYDEATVQQVTQLQRMGGFEPNGQVDRPFWDFLAQLYNHR